MIYSCLTKYKEQFSMIGEVIDNKDEFFQSIFRNNIELFLIAQSFIDEHITFDYFKKFIDNYSAVRDTKIVVFGKDITNKASSIYYIDEDESEYERILSKSREITQDRAPFTAKLASKDKFIENLQVSVNEPFSEAADELLFSSYLVRNATEIKELLANTLGKEISYTKELTDLQATISTEQVAKDSLQRQLLQEKENHEMTIKELERYKSAYKNVVDLVYAKNGVKLPEYSPVTIPQSKRVIYFKESSKLSFFDTFVLMFRRMLRNNGAPATIHIFLPEKAFKLASIYKDYINTNNITKSQLTSSDTVTVGYDRSILTTILNYSATDTIIIVDKTNQDIDLVEGQYIKFGVMSDVSDNIYDVDEDKILSYDIRTMCIPTIKGYNDESEQSRFSLYSRLPSMLDILKKVGV